jgi:CheY-like chemotaxis protein
MARPLVLIVDDDCLVRFNTAAILEDAGFHVMEACDAAHALTVLQNSADVNLVCTDVQKPG